MGRIRSKISEMISGWSGGLREGVIMIGGLSKRFWPRPPLSVGFVNVDKTRQMYRNDKKEINLGTGFARPIVDLTTAFIGLPHSSIGDEIFDEFLNDCIHRYWSAELQQMIRDACRDSTTVVRFRKSLISNPLMTSDEVAAGYLQIVPPESCTIFYDPEDGKTITKALIIHDVEQEDNTQQPQLIFRTFKGPRTRMHRIIEEITPTEFTYYDETFGVTREDLNATNDWGFVPLVEVFNEYDAYLQRGQSDLEAAFVFMTAFHDVQYQTLQAHKQHSIPKVKFKVNDMMTFLVNNFPDSFQLDENGQPIMESFNGQVSWKGTEIFFFEAEEDAEFMEARSVLGDSISLMDFLINCICIASEMPRWAFGLDVGAADKTETLVFTRKIERKRTIFTPYIQQLCKMALAVNRMAPERPLLSWPEVDPNTVATQAQALQQQTMSLELLQERQLISDQTARSSLKPLIPAMKSSQQEAKDAKGNVVPVTIAATGPPTGPNSPNGRAPVPPVTGKNVGGKNQ